MKKIKEKQNNIEIKYNEILSNGNINEEDTLKEIEQLFNKDKTNTKILIKYLNLKLKENKEEFLLLFKRYSCFLSEEVIKNSNLIKYNINNKTSMELFFSLYEFIKNCSLYKIENRIDFFHSISMNPDLNKLSSNNYVSYEKPELYIYVLYNQIILNIVDRIYSFKYDTDRDKSNEYITEKEEEIKKWLIFKKVEENKSKANENELKIYNELLKENNNEKINLEEKLNDLKEGLSILYNISSEDFLKYFAYFSNFLEVIEKDFRKRFSELDKSKNKKDFELFTYFSFFISHFDFSKLNNYYINMWVHSLKTDFDIKENLEILKNNSYNKLYEYNIIDNELILKICLIKRKIFTIYKIRNISDYIIPNIIEYLSPYYTNLKSKEESLLNYEKCLDTSKYESYETYIHEYEIENYLNINAYEKKLYINIIKSYWKPFLIKIFTSKAIKDTFRKLNYQVSKNFEFYDFLIEEELNIIFDNVKLYQFPIAEVSGLTITPIFQIFEYYEGFSSKYGKNKSRLVSLVFNLVTNTHEIIGHINIRIQNYLSEKKLKSPLVNNSKSLSIKKEESGDFIEELLYGRIINELTHNQMLFLLDENNYNCTCDEFKKNFSECSENYQPSENLKEFLSLLNIKIEQEENPLRTYTIGKEILKATNSTFRRPSQHENRLFYYSPEIVYSRLENLKKILKRIKKNN